MENLISLTDKKVSPSQDQISASGILDSEGNLIDPFTGAPSDAFAISDKDETGTTKYYGFLRKDGYWYIMTWETIADIFRYAKGSANYPDNWANRGDLTYDYYNNVF